MINPVKRVKLDYTKVINKMHKGQGNLLRAILKDGKRYCALMAHRRYGKDFIAFIIVILCALQHKGNYYIYAPFMRQAKEIVIDGKTMDGKPLVETLVPKELLLKAPQTGVVNKSDWSITLFNGSKIFIRGADDPNAAVGIGARGMVFTEAALMKPGFYQYMKPAIDTVINKTDFGFVLFISTPRGKNNWFTKLFVDYFKKLPQKPELRKRWYVDIQKGSQSKAWNGAPVLSKNQLEQYQLEMTPDMYEQEIELNLNASTNGAWYSTEISKAYSDKRIGRYGSYVLDEYCNNIYSGFYFKNSPVYIGWDLGRRDHTVLWFFQINPHNGRIRFIHHYRMNGVGLQHYAEYQKRWLKKRGLPQALNILPHDGNVTEFISETKRSDALADLGLRVFTLGKSELATNDLTAFITQINTIRKLWDKVEIDSEECSLGVIKLQEYIKKYNKSLGEYIDVEDHDANDKASDDAAAFRTAMIYYSIYLKNDINQTFENNYTQGTATSYIEEDYGYLDIY